MHDVLLVERVDGDGVGGRGGRRKGHKRSRWCVWRLEAMRLRGCSNIATQSRRALIPCCNPDSAVRSDNAAMACNGSGSSAPWCLRCSLISWPLPLLGPCVLLPRPGVMSIVAISSHGRLTKANLDGFLPSPYKATSQSFTALMRTPVSSAVNRSWRDGNPPWNKRACFQRECEVTLWLVYCTLHPNHTYD